jgi:hypothetical protein
MHNSGGVHSSLTQGDTSVPACTVQVVCNWLAHATSTISHAAPAAPVRLDISRCGGTTGIQDCTNSAHERREVDQGWMLEEREKDREENLGGGVGAAATAAPSDFAGRADAARAVAAGHADAQSLSGFVRQRHRDVGSEQAEEELERIRLRFSISLHTALRADVRRALQVHLASTPPPCSMCLLPHFPRASGETL